MYSVIKNINKKIYFFILKNDEKIWTPYFQPPPPTKKSVRCIILKWTKILNSKFNTATNMYPHLYLFTLVKKKFGYYWEVIPIIST